MRVCVTGGTGFLGPAVVQEMLDAGHEVVVLEHRKPVDVADHSRLHRVKGDVTDRASLEKAFAGCEAVVHLVAIIVEEPKKGITFERIHVEGTRNVVDAATGVGVRRFLLMSANGVDDPSMPPTPYFRTKRAMESMVKGAPFHWTIFRPSYIAGPQAGGFDRQFAEIVDKFPVLPAFNGGNFMIQPVARKNVAEAFARALANPGTHGRTYTLVGPERMTWKEYLRRLARVRGKKRAIAPAPAGVVMFGAKRMPFLMPTKVDPDQIRMMIAGNIGDGSEAVRDLELRLIPWEQAVSGLARR